MQTLSKKQFVVAKTKKVFSYYLTWRFIEKNNCIKVDNNTESIYLLNL